MRMFSVLILFLLGAVVAGVHATAALTVTNGNFQGDGIAVGGLGTSVADWYNTTQGGWLYLLDGDYNSQNFSGGEYASDPGDTVLLIDNISGYIYQNIGTVSEGTTHVEIEFDALERLVSTGVGQSQNRVSGGWRFDLYPGPFENAADGTDISGQINPLATVNIAAASVFQSTSTNNIVGGDPERVVDIKRLLDVSTVAAGTELWLRFAPYVAASSLDNISVAERVLIPGDVTGEGLVDEADLQVILSNMFKSANAREQGDLTGDFVVNFADFAEWKAAPHSASSVSSGAIVPEPESVMLLLGMIAACGYLARHKS